MNGSKKEPAKRRLILIDGNNLLYRAFYAVPMLTTSRGEPTNAVFGYTRTLIRILSEHPAEYVAVAFDSPVPTFRHRRYEEYKAHRPPTPDVLKPQMAVAREITDALGIRMVEAPGFEADDVIATLVRKAEGEGLREIIIVTGDMDVLQLVSERVKVVEAGGGRRSPGFTTGRRWRGSSASLRRRSLTLGRSAGTPRTTFPESPGWGRRPPSNCLRSTGPSRGFSRT
ncbi:MAG TPA: hypothetical protein EYP65_05705 [Armatimonadetes bacterium]|nr:hypothetical protein [Armatimonadota bacterium]